MVRTVSEAREAVASEPKRWKLAVVEATSFPLLDSPHAVVRLYATKKGANEALRERKSELVEQGYKLKTGALGRGFVALERGNETVGLGIDYRGRCGGNPGSAEPLAQDQ